jgi:hypothetical protein
VELSQVTALFAHGNGFELWILLGWWGLKIGFLVSAIGSLCVLALGKRTASNLVVGIFLALLSLTLGGAYFFIQWLTH